MGVSCQRITLLSLPFQAMTVGKTEAMENTIRIRRKEGGPTKEKPVSRLEERLC